MGALPGWAELEAAVPQVAATMRRYLTQIGCVLRPGSVGGADLALRCFAAFLVETVPEVTSIAQVTRRHIEDYKPWLAARPGQNKPRRSWRDFFTADLLDGTQAHVLAVIEHATRRIRILGVTLHPTGVWTAQQARNLVMDLGEQAHQVKFLIRDRGSNYTAAFDAVLADAGIRTVLCNVRTPA